MLILKNRVLSYFPIGPSELLDYMLPPDILQNGEFETIYFQTNPTYIKSPIHIPKSTIGKPDTVKIRHFFALLHQDLVVLGLEVFVYLQIYSDFVENTFTYPNVILLD